MSASLDEPSSSSGEWVEDFGGTDDFGGYSVFPATPGLAADNLPATPSLAGDTSGDTPQESSNAVLSASVSAANDVIPEQERAWMPDENLKHELVLQFAERAKEVALAKGKGGAGMHGVERQRVTIRMNKENVEFLNSLGMPSASMIDGFLTALREASEGFDIKSHLDNDEATPAP